MRRIKINTVRIIFPCLFFLLILALPVIGFGVTPAKTLIKQGETVVNGMFWIVNNEHQLTHVKMGVSGELARYIALETEELYFREDEETLPVAFTITLPPNLPPGESTATIFIEQDLQDSNTDVIASKLRLKHKIIAHGPYPPKYVEVKINFHENRDALRFVSEVKNLGTEDLQKVKTTFYFQDKEQKPQAVETETTSLQRKEDKLLESNVPREQFQQGEFEVRAITSFDEQEIELYKKLLVGRPEVEVTYFPSYFIAKEMNHYTLELLNKWNALIENIFVEVEVKKDNQKMDAFRTKSVAIGAKSREQIQDFFDAKNKDSGEYRFDMIVHFWDTHKMQTKTFSSQLLSRENMNSISNAGANSALLSGAAVNNASLPGKNFDGNGHRKSIIPWIFGGMLLISAGIYIGYRYIHRHDYEEGERAW